MKRLLFGFVLAGCLAREPAPAPVVPAPPKAVPLPPPADRTSPHLALGMPAGGHDTILDKQYFVVGLDRELSVARWVAWRLDRNDLGSAPRARGFHPDPAFPLVEDRDYAGSGYDRGHLCPSADRTSSRGANLATFVLTNAHPQVHDLNAGPWEDLEKRARELARSGRTIYVVAGGLFDAAPTRIGRGVAVPRASFKVMVVLGANEGVESVRADTPTVAVVMPNDASAKGRGYTEFLTSIRAVEEASGYDFNPRVAHEIQESIETRVSRDGHAL